VKAVKGPPPQMGNVPDLGTEWVEKLSGILQAAGYRVEAPLAVKFLPPEKFRVILPAGMASTAAVATESLVEDSTQGDASAAFGEIPGTPGNFKTPFGGGANDPIKYLSAEAAKRGYTVPVGKKAGQAAAIKVQIADTPMKAVFVPVESGGAIGIAWTDPVILKKLSTDGDGGVRSTLTVPLEVPTEAPTPDMSEDELAMYLHFADEFTRPGEDPRRSGRRPGMNWAATAFGTLVEKNWARITRTLSKSAILRVAPSLKGDPATVMDITAETLRKAWDAVSRGKFDIRKSAFLPWMVTIAANTTRDHLRYQYNNPPPTQYPDEMVGGSREQESFAAAVTVGLMERDELTARPFRRALRGATVPSTVPAVRRAIPVGVPEEPTSFVGKAARGIGAAAKAALSFVGPKAFELGQHGAIQTGAEELVARRLALEPSTAAARTYTKEMVKSRLDEIASAIDQLDKEVTNWSTRLKTKLGDLSAYIDVSPNAKSVIKQPDQGKPDPFADANNRRQLSKEYSNVVLKGVIGVEVDAEFTRLMEDIYDVLENLADLAVYTFGLPSSHAQTIERLVSSAENMFSELENNYGPRLVTAARLDNVDEFKSLIKGTTETLVTLMAYLGSIVDRLVVMKDSVAAELSKVKKGERVVSRFSKPDTGLDATGAALPAPEQADATIIDRTFSTVKHKNPLWPWADPESKAAVFAALTAKGVDAEDPRVVSAVDQRIETDMDRRMSYYLAQVFTAAANKMTKQGLKVQPVGLPEIITELKDSGINVEDPKVRQVAARVLQQFIRSGYIKPLADRFGNSLTDYPTYYDTKNGGLAKVIASMQRK